MFWSLRWSQVDIFNKFESIFSATSKNYNLHDLFVICGSKAKPRKIQQKQLDITVAMGGRVKDRLSYNDYFREYFESNNPDILAIIETQTMYRSKFLICPVITSFLEKLSELVE